MEHDAAARANGNEELTPAVVARLPLPGFTQPVQHRFSPDGRLVTFLFSEDGSLSRQLWAFGPETGERELLVRPPGEGETDANLSREEQLRRERQRQRGFGVTSYAWAKRGATLLVPVRGALYVQHGAGGSLRRVTDEEPPCIDPQLNEDGAAVAFVRAGELYCLDLTRDDAVPVRLTFDAAPVQNGEQLVTNGLAEFVAQEEMDRATGFWWSPDGRFIAFEQADSSPVPPYTIAHQGEARYDTEVHRYPFAGGPNVRVRLGVVRAAGGAVRWLPLPGVTDGDGYLARVNWAPDGTLLAQVITRDQRRLELRRIDAWAGTTTTLIAEEAKDWLNLSHDLRCVSRAGGPPDDFEILWSSERDGFRQLFLYGRDGALLRRLTSGDWPVDGVIAVDEARRLVYFAGSESPLEQHIWRVSLDGGEPQRLTTEPGMHFAAFSDDCTRWVESFQSLETPPRVTLRDADGKTLCEIFAGDAGEAKRLGLRPPALVSFPSRDGVTLYGAIYHPPNLEPGKRYPVIVEVYGGPHVQMVYNGWGNTVDLRAQYLARQGYIVFKCDNRGSARRGHAFEAAIFKQMGSVEVQDQVDGVRFLASLSEADTTRTGVYGWSYGGYMTLMCLLKAPDIFKAGVSGAPCVDWDGYDTFYTERYMQTPQANPDGYREASALTHAAKLHAPLLLLHGMLDENVHFRHTARLITALNDADKPYELAVYPNERHGPRSPAQRAALERRLAEFFQAHL
ncbi:MAG TPA: S9 family peptidase [Dehalococcoidia bacterium]|nr:S9 family peptidase [Dehalococcoidia bacterium]